MSIYDKYQKEKETYTVIDFLGNGGFGEAYLINSNKTKKIT